MTDPYRAMCEQLMELVEGKRYDGSAVVARARALLAQPEPEGPTLLERALSGDATAARQFLHEAGFTDKQGQWLPQYQPIPEAND